MLTILRSYSQDVVFSLWTWCLPNSCGETLHNLSGGVVEGDQQLLLQSVSFEGSQEVECLLRLLDHRFGVDCQFEVLGTPGMLVPKNINEGTLSTQMRSMCRKVQGMFSGLL